MGILELAEYSTSYSYSSSTNGSGVGLVIGLGMLLVWLIIWLAFMTFMIIAMWKVFVKAGKPGWASIVPFYNLYVMLEIVGRPTWWLLMFFVPFANIVFAIIMTLDVAKAYGKDTGFGVLLILLPVVGYPILGFSKDIKYVGPVAENS